MRSDLPHVLEIERGLLGAILHDRHLSDDVFEKLPTPEAFYSPKHRQIYSAILKLAGASEPIEVGAVVTILREGNSNSILATDLVELTEQCFFTHYAEYAAKIVDRHRLRQLIQVANDTIKTAHERQDDATWVLDTVEQQIFALTRKHSGMDNLQTMADIVAASLEEINSHQVGDAQKKYIQSGIGELDRLLHGLKPGKYYLLAGRPSHGKSQMALQIAYYAASMGFPVGFVSLEMPVDELGMRLLCTVSRVDSYLSQTQNGLDSFKWDKISRAQVKLYNIPLHITALPKITIPELRGLCRRMVSKHDAKLIIIDYLQLIDPGQQESREREVAYISRNLKEINMELHVPLIALSQLRRLPPTVKDREPILADLRDSGTLEQDADVVVFVYHGSTGEKKIIVGKHRGGRCGKVKMVFIEGRWEEPEWKELPF